MEKWKTPLDMYMSKQNITDNQLARELGMNQPTISRYRSGKRKRPHEELLQKIGDYLGVTVAELKGKKLPEGTLPPEAIYIAELWLRLEPQDRKKAKAILEALKPDESDNKSGHQRPLPPKPHR